MDLVDFRQPMWNPEGVMDGRLSMTQIYPTGGTEAIRKCLSAAC